MGFLGDCKQGKRYDFLTAVEDTEEEDEEEAEKDVAVVEAEKGAEEMMISEFSLRRFIL